MWEQQWAMPPFESEDGLGYTLAGSDAYTWLASGEPVMAGCGQMLAPQPAGALLCDGGAARSYMLPAMHACLLSIDRPPSPPDTDTPRII